MRATLTIDLDAIAANWRALDALSADAVETGAVVKADAYGLGAARVAPHLWQAGARSFFVALAEEGVALRQLLPQADIYVFSGLMPGDADLCLHADLIPLLNSVEQVRAFAANPGGRYGLQLDTGMNRLGLEPQDIVDIRHLLTDLPVLVISHLACADAARHPQNTAQLNAFADMTREFPGIRLSLAATGGILLGPDYHHDVTRPGIGLFGGQPFFDAKPVVSLDLPVIQTREVTKGESVGYGADWTAERPARISTVSAGYADGILRALGGKAALYSGITPCPVVGRISMDLITVDVTGLTDIPPSLSLLGSRQGIDPVAAQAGTIGYEILTSLGDRYERVYKGG